MGEAYCLTSLKISDNNDSSSRIKIRGVEQKMGQKINKKQKKQGAGLICPCRVGEATTGQDSLLQYRECCEPYHKGEKRVLTAEALMRSRFSAFALNLTDYLLKSWHSATRPEVIEDQQDVQWFYLKILATESNIDPITEQKVDYVTFEARYRFDGKAGKFREKSRFIHEENQLRYIDGIFLD